MEETASLAVWVSSIVAAVIVALVIAHIVWRSIAKIREDNARLREIHRNTRRKRPF